MPEGNTRLITEEDRRVIGKELAGRGAQQVRIWTSAQQMGPGQGKQAAHPKAKFLNKPDSQPLPGEKAHAKPAGIVTVQEEGAVMKEFSAVRGGESQDRFKSASLFWEIRLKESLGKLSVPADFELRLNAESFEALPLTAKHAHAAGTLPWHHRDPFDRMLVAQAQVEKLQLLTADGVVGAYGSFVLVS